MSNLNSGEDFNNSDDESQELNLGRKYIKKSKLNKKKPHKIISSTYKKKRCEFYNKGACNKGSQCTFSHSFIPDVAKKICKFFLTNSCSKGQECPYSHNTKRYPCKFFHIQQHCGQGNDCRFSHQQIDPDFEQEFLKDNEDFLIKLKKQGQNLQEKYVNYIQKNDLLNKQKKLQNQPPKSTINLPFIFGFTVTKTIPREQSRNQQLTNTNKKSQTIKKSNNNQLPFSIRLVHKNRQAIPQKLFQNQNQQFNQKIQNCNQESLKSESSLQRNQIEEMCQQKISQGIELTPESKSQRFTHGIQYYMCSYN